MTTKLVLCGDGPGTKFSHAQTVSSVPSIDSPYLLFNLQLRVNLIIVNMRKNAQVPCGYHCRGREPDTRDDETAAKVAVGV